VLTHRCERARRAPVDDTTIHSQDDANGARKIAAAIFEIARNNCAAGISNIHPSNDRRAIDIVAAGQ
jgi:hypothetical protein